ncbi:hypothetical protein ACIBHX_01310 [Nonomuraea sp. NPDC050536]|uniref:hypothetical protein n=1 Tax=Nonomuraea sp. NPDC050536 TaxID=3364366 RepID=UPI0037C93FC2
MEPPNLHITRGIIASTLDEARAMHNAFISGGPQPGIEIARSLGDLSHNVYTPADGVDTGFAAKPDELLFVDRWAEPDGMEAFFSNPSAQEAGDRLYSSREESEWTPAPGGFTFWVPAPSGTTAPFIAMTRRPAPSASAAITALTEFAVSTLPAARRRGQVSHALFVRRADVIVARPASNARHDGGKRTAESVEPVEFLTMDSWLTLEGLQEHYSDASRINGLPSTRHHTVVWQQAPGFSEW